MGMTAYRWGGGIAAACAALAVLVLPFPATSRLEGLLNGPEAVTTAAARSTAVRIRLDDAVRTYRARGGIARWRRAAAVHEPIVIDESVPTEHRIALRRVAETEWARIGAEASSGHAAVFIYADTTPIPRATATDNGPRRRYALEPNRPVDIVYALPAVTDGRCVVLARLRLPGAAAAERLSDGSLLGPCAFYAAFGAPGAGIAAWLHRTGFAVARRADWDTPRALPIDGAARYALADAPGRCLTGGGEACLASLGLGGSTARGLAGTRRSSPSAGAQQETATTLVDDRGPIPQPYGPRQTRALGEAEGRFLADLAREAGPARFAAFWRSPGRPEAAFESAIGRPMESWTRDWLVRTYGRPVGRPGPSAADVAWLVIALPLCVVVAARARERILVAGARGGG